MGSKDEQSCEEAKEADEFTVRSILVLECLESSLFLYIWFLTFDCCFELIDILLHNRNKCFFSS